MIWRIEYRWEKARRSYTIGAYTGDDAGVSLAEAREVLVQVRRWLREGKDPAEEKRAANKPKEEKITFGRVALEWFQNNTTAREAAYRRQVKSKIENVLIPAIGDIPIAELRGRHLLPLFREYEERGHKLLKHSCHTKFMTQSKRHTIELSIWNNVGK